MYINIIAAYCKNNGIGINNNLPWKYSSDLKKFKKLTIGNGNNAIIMGKNTWLSLNSTGLKNRDNLILSKSLLINNKIDNSDNIVKTFQNLQLLLDFINKKNYDEIWIIGGEKIYDLFLNNSILEIDYIYITYIYENYECNKYFPKINLNEYAFISKSIHNNISRIYDIVYKNYKSK